MVSDMKAKTIALISVFAAITILLVGSPLKLDAPYAPFLKYQIWEIPIVAVLLLFGLAASVLVVILNTLVLFVVFPGDLPTGPLYNLIAVLTMLLGISIAEALVKRYRLKHETVTATMSTVLSIVLRTTAMSLVNYTVLRFPYPIGYSLPEIVIIGFIPLIAIFNATLTLYTVPLGYFVAKATGTSVKTFT
jgi:riboflavin transporter FmnP